MSERDGERMDERIELSRRYLAMREEQRRRMADASLRAAYAAWEAWLWGLDPPHRVESSAEAWE